MANFDFITSPEFRKSLESDYAELMKCVAGGAWKAVHVLAGSIIEATLIDSLISNGGEAGQLYKMSLEDLIFLCRDTGIISSETMDLSTVVRHYRNLIHPGRVERLKKKVDSRGGLLPASL